MGKVLKTTGIVLSLGCLITITVLSLSHNVSIPDYIVGADKGAHFLAYCGLGFSLFLALFRYGSARPVRKNILPFICAFAVSFTVGYFIEILQPAFGRCYEALDLVADAAGSLSGVIIGCICVVFVLKIANSRKAK